MTSEVTHKEDASVEASFEKGGDPSLIFYALKLGWARPIEVAVEAQQIAGPPIISPQETACEETQRAR